MTDLAPALLLAQKIAGLFSAFPGVEAVGLAGSQTVAAGDSTSDIDLYIYTTVPIPLQERAALVEKLGASKADLNLHFWDLGDEWFDKETGIEVDVMYWEPAWIADQIDRVLVRHEASLGYTTCFWNTICNTQILLDRSGWLRALQERAKAPYPEDLRRAILAMNSPVLRSVIPSYTHQIEKALRREDLVSVNHRVAALIASYFDIIFAINRMPHPGEKRLVQVASQRCAKIPRGMPTQVEDVLRAAASPGPDLMVAITTLLDCLDDLLREEGLDLPGKPEI